MVHDLPLSITGPSVECVSCELQGSLRILLLFTARWARRRQELPLIGEGQSTCGMNDGHVFSPVPAALARGVPRERLMDCLQRQPARPARPLRAVEPVPTCRLDRPSPAGRR